MKAGGHDRINVQNNPVNLLDPYGLDTKGSGFEIGGALLGVVGTLTFLTVEDDRGGYGIEISRTAGGATEVAGISVSWVVSSTSNANSINDLNGSSGIVGIGADKVLGYDFEYEIGTGYTGKSHSVGVDLSAIPFKIHGGASDTIIINFHDIIENFFGFLFGNNEKISKDCE